MLACLLVLALADGPSDPLAKLRQALVEWFEATDRQLESYEKELGRMTQPPEPILGLRLETVEASGTQTPRRATMVVGVIMGSPAEKVGIRVGDRISAIGVEELDFETGKAVTMYLFDFPDTVPLVVERDGKNLQLQLKREVVPCLVAAQAAFDAASWKKRVASLRRALSEQAAGVPKLVTLQGITLAQQNLEKGHAVARAILGNIAYEIGAAKASACVP